MRLLFFLAVFGLISKVFSDFIVNSPDSMVDDITKEGHPLLKGELEKEIDESKKDHQAFVSANASCQQVMIPMITKCQNCVKDVCKQRFVKLGCYQMNEFNKAFDGAFETLFQRIKRFFTETIPHFFTEDLATVFKHDLPRYFKHDVKDFFTKSIPDFFNNEFANFFKSDLPKFFTKSVPAFFQNEFTTFVKDDVPSFFKSTIPKAFERAKDYIKDLFGRKRRAPHAEPHTCSEFNTAKIIYDTCSYYIMNCSSCLPSKEELETACPQLARAYESMKKHNWLLTAAMANGSVFRVQSLSDSGEETQDGIHENILVKLTIFGQDTSVTIQGPIKPSDLKAMTPEIIDKALQWYKNNVTQMELLKFQTWRNI